MPKVEITIPEHLEMQIARAVEEGEFLNREGSDRRPALDRAEGVQDQRAHGRRGRTGLEDDGMMGHDDEYVFWAVSARLAGGTRL